MAKTRLLVSDREAIARAIIAHKFDALAATHVATEGSLAEQVYNRAYPAETQRLMAKMPEGALPSAGTITIAVNGQRHSVDFVSERRVFDSHRHWHTPALSVNDDDELGAAIVELIRAKEDARGDRRDAQKKLEVTLAQFRTFDDLLAEWPDAEVFIRARWQTHGEYVARVPAVRLEELSKALDLPPVLAEAA